MSTHTLSALAIHTQYPALWRTMVASCAPLAKFSDSRHLSWTFEATDEADDIAGYFAYGDDALDREAVATVEQFRSCSVWGWCCVRVDCSYVTDAGTLTGGPDYLGACSYESFASFMQSGDYAVGMMLTSFASLAHAIRTASTHFPEAS